MDFYLTAVPTVIGPLVLAPAILGLLVDRKRLDWREGLLLSWCVVPILFFTLMPIKGFQYLLPLAPPVAVLAARALTSASIWSNPHSANPALAYDSAERRLSPDGADAIVPAMDVVQPSTDQAFLAGTVGCPGLEAGNWIGSNLPEGSTILTVGPSMANVIAFYGHRQAYGLSVSPNPWNRNPSYTAVENADAQLRNGAIQYVVWDSFSAARRQAFPTGCWNTTTSTTASLSNSRPSRSMTRRTKDHPAPDHRLRAATMREVPCAGCRAGLGRPPHCDRRRSAGRRHLDHYSDQARRLDDAGQPLLRQLLRHLSGC